MPGERVQTVVDIGDLLAEHLRVDLTGDAILQPPHDMIGDLFDGAASEGRGADRVQLGADFGQQRFDGVRRGVLVAGGAERRRDLAIHPGRDMLQQRSQFTRVSLTLGFVQSRVELLQRQFEAAGVDGRLRARLERLADAIDAARQIVEWA